MQLHLLRHGHAGDPTAWDGPDSERPLSGKGRSQAERLGRFLAGVGFTSDAIITSPKVRANETAAIIAGHLGASVTVDERLAGALDPETVDAILAACGDPARPILVGHDPDFTELVADLCLVAGVVMRKGSFVRIEIERPLRSRSGTLRWLVPPDLLKPER